MEIRPIILMISACLMFALTSCEEGVTLTYDEASQGAILNKSLSTSPSDNVTTYLSTVGASFSKIRILNEGGKTCGCSITGGSCLCKLDNTVGAGHSCGEQAKCTKNKVITIKVAEEDKDKFAAVGFK